MNTLELIGWILGSNALSIGLTKYLDRRSTNIANNQQNDKVLYDRIAFLEARVSKLEKCVCFDEDCPRRL